MHSRRNSNVHVPVLQTEAHCWGIPDSSMSCSMLHSTQNPKWWSVPKALQDFPGKSMQSGTSANGEFAVIACHPTTPEYLTSVGSQLHPASRCAGMSYWEDSCLRMVKMVRSCCSLPNASAHIQRNPDPRPPVETSQVRWDSGSFLGKHSPNESAISWNHCDYYDSWCISCQLPKSSLSLSPRQSKSSRFWAYHGFTCKDLLYFATILKPPQTFRGFTLPPVRRSNSVGYGKENQLFAKDNERPGAKSVTRPVK